MTFSNVPCLLSKANSPMRSTLYTVEAVSLDSLEESNKSWIGINQTAVNQYVGFFLKNNALPEMISTMGEDIKREVPIGSSRIDFLIGSNVLLEIKMPLIHCGLKEGEIAKSASPFTSFDRLIKHFIELGKYAKDKRAILALVYLYNAPNFSRPAPNAYNKEILRVATSSVKKGVEQWQLNFSIDPHSISLINYFHL